MNEHSILPDTHKIKVHLIFHHIQLTLKFHCNIVLALKSHQSKHTNTQTKLSAKLPPKLSLMGNVKSPNKSSLIGKLSTIPQPVSIFPQP